MKKSNLKIWTKIEGIRFSDVERTNDDAQLESILIVQLELSAAEEELTQLEEDAADVEDVSIGLWYWRRVIELLGVRNNSKRKGSVALVNNLKVCRLLSDPEWSHGEVTKPKQSTTVL